MTRHETRAEPDLERAAMQVWRAYKIKIMQTRTNRSLTSIAKAGVELDVIRCFLQDMVDREIIEWLKGNRDVAISKSTMGRFCRDLYQLGATRFGVLKAQTAGGGKDENGIAEK